MRVLFVAQALIGTAGSSVGSRMHLNVIKQLVGEENAFVVNVGVNAEKAEEDHYLAFGKYPNKMSRVMRNLQGNTYMFSGRIIQNICDFAKQCKIDFIFLDNSYYGNLVTALKNELPGIPVAAFYHDIKAQLFPIWMQSANFFDRIDYAIGIRQEKKSTYNTNANIVLNKKDGMLLTEYYGKSPDYFLPVCVDQGEKAHCSDPYENSTKKHIIFVGTTYKPNIDGITWFYDNVFCNIKNTFDLWIIGKGMEKLALGNGDTELHLKGFVESLDAYYRYADVVIAPLTGGGGMKIKTAEAFSYGKFFVGTSESLEGYYENLSEETKESIVFKCDTIDEFTNALNKIGEMKTCKCNLSLVDIYEKHYSMNAAQRIMKNIMEDMTGEKL